MKNSSASISPEERAAQQKQLWTAVKGVWKLHPKLRLGELLVTAMNEMTGKKPRDLIEVDDDLLREALERMAIKTRAMQHRSKEK